MKSFFLLIIRILFLPLRLPFLLVARYRAKKNRDFFAEIELSGSYEDSAETTGLASIFQKTEMRFFQLVQRFEALTRAARLRKGKLALLIKIKDLKTGQGRAWEVHHMIKAMHKAGIRVYVWLQTGNLSHYYIASAADKVFLSPAGSLDFSGLRSEILYFGGLFNRLDIKPNFIHVGDYKTGPEPFTRKTASKAQKDQVKNLLGSFYEQFESTFSEKTNTSLKELQKMSPISSLSAHEQGLIDGILYEEQLKEFISIELKKKKFFKKKPRAIELDALLKRLSSANRPLLFSVKKKKIAMVTGQGAIIDHSEPVPTAINLNDYSSAIAAIRSSAYDGYILRFNSPGGSALASDLLWQKFQSMFFQDTYFEPNSHWLKLPGKAAYSKAAFIFKDEKKKKKNKKIEEKAAMAAAAEAAQSPSQKKKRKAEKQKNTKKTKQNSEIPVYVSASDIAASGGYYLSMVSNQPSMTQEDAKKLKTEFFATPMSIVGSIGVWGGKFNAEGLFKKLDLHIEKNHAGSDTGMYSLFSDFTAAQKKALEANMQEMYALFKDRVTRSRSNLEKNIEEVASGRVFTGVQALQNGLVDKNGGLFDILKQLRADLKLADHHRLIIDVHPRIKAPLVPGKNRLGMFLYDIKTWQSLAKEHLFFLDNRFF